MFKVTSCLFEAIPPSHIIIFIIRRQLVQSDALFPAVQSEASVLLAQPSRKKKKKISGRSFFAIHGKKPLNMLLRGVGREKL